MEEDVDLSQMINKYWSSSVCLRILWITFVVSSHVSSDRSRSPEAERLTALVRAVFLGPYKYLDPSAVTFDIDGRSTGRPYCGTGTFVQYDLYLVGMRSALIEPP